MTTLEKFTGWFTDNFGSGQKKFRFSGNTTGITEESANFNTKGSSAELQTGDSYKEQIGDSANTQKGDSYGFLEGTKRGVHFGNSNSFLEGNSASVQAGFGSSSHYGLKLTAVVGANISSTSGLQVSAFGLLPLLGGALPVGGFKIDISNANSVTVKKGPGYVFDTSTKCDTTTQRIASHGKKTELALAVKKVIGEETGCYVTMDTTVLGNHVLTCLSTKVTAGNYSLIAGCAEINGTGSAKLTSTGVTSVKGATLSLKSYSSTTVEGLLIKIG